MIRVCTINDKEILEKYLQEEPYAGAILAAIEEFGFDEKFQTSFRAVPCAGGVSLHPLLDGLDPVGISPSRHTCDAVFVHAPHDVRDHGL